VGHQLGLSPSTTDGDPTGKHDLQLHREIQPKKVTVPGHLIQPINPATSIPAAKKRTIHLMEAPVLRALVASLLRELMSQDVYLIVTIQ
jgi:hypothetical protein